MMPSDMHRPTDEFREKLEWEVLRCHRRNTRDARDARDARDTREHAPVGARTLRWAQAAVIVIVSGAIGVTAGMASAQIRQSSARDSLLANARAEAMLAQTRFNIAKAEADDVSVRVRIGAADQESFAAAHAELLDMEARRNAVGLNIEEINASGQAPRDDLGAPL